MKAYPKKKGFGYTTAQPKPKARAFQMILETAEDEVDVALGNQEQEAPYLEFKIWSIHPI